MKQVIIFFLLTTNYVWALVPLEGIIYGDVRDIAQNDPFAGMLSTRYFDGNIDDKNTAMVLYYTALLKQGINLKNSCEGVDNSSYSSFWKEDNAKRSVVAALQYIGLDLTLKAIIEYAKLVELSESEYKNLYTNLMKNSCSKNLSVYSLKLLESNFKYQWNKSLFKLPKISKNPYFPLAVRKMHNSMSTAKKEFEYTIRNFHALCSWNLDVDNLGELTNYLKNPFVMSFLINNFTKSTIGIDDKTQEIFVKKSINGVQVACENMICRKRSEETFSELFPRMDGTLSIRDDLKILYCSHFNKLKNKSSDKTSGNSSINKSLEVSNFISLITGIPDLGIMSENTSELLKYFKNNIEQRWDKWAKRQNNTLNIEQLYEESMEIKLRTQVHTFDTEVGKFNIKFDVTLGELDKVLDLHDKFHVLFHIDLPVTYVEYLRKQIPFYYNNKFHKKLAQLEHKFIQTIEHQLTKKEKYFKIPLWNKKMTSIIGNELMSQITSARLLNRTTRGKKFIKIPVSFYYGVGALQYIQKKYIFRNNLQEKLSFN